MGNPIARQAPGVGSVGLAGAFQRASPDIEQVEPGRQAGREDREVEARDEQFLKSGARQEERRSQQDPAPPAARRKRLPGIEQETP